MKNCSNLYFLSTLACKLAECLSEDEVSVLSSDLVVLSDMLANILARQDACQNAIAAHKSDSSDAVSANDLPHTSKTLPSLTNT